MVAHYIKNFFHLEGRRQCFDQDCGFNSRMGNADKNLGKVKDIIPQTGFLVIFNLREVVKRPPA